MIIHHSENIKSYHLFIQKPLKYSDNFTFIPLRFKKDKNFIKCILQTPLLFTPYGICKTQNNKNIIDISFQNIDNDKSQHVFHKNLKYIYDTVYEKYKYDYIVNDFLKKTDFNDCLRLKINDTTKLFDESKNNIEKIDNYSYGNFIIELDGLWINEDNIWFQWNLLQAKIRLPTHLTEYSFVDEIIIHKIDDKYDKMLKMGVPKAAVERQRLLDGNGTSKGISTKGIPKPPPPPPPGMLPERSTTTAPKINASDLKSVVLKKGKKIDKKPIKKVPNHFEPPTLEELQTTLSRLRKTR